MFLYGYQFLLSTTSSLIGERKSCRNCKSPNETKKLKASEFFCGRAKGLTVTGARNRVGNGRRYWRLTLLRTQCADQQLNTSSLSLSLSLAHPPSHLARHLSTDTVGHPASSERAPARFSSWLHAISQHSPFSVCDYTSVIVKRQTKMTTGSKNLKSVSDVASKGVTRNLVWNGIKSL